MLPMMENLTDAALLTCVYADEFSGKAGNSSWRLHSRPLAHFRTARHELRHVPLSREALSTLPDNIELSCQHFTTF
jgi:hypothetical protein